MLMAEKANRRVRIADEKKDEYIGMGYIVKNMDGSLVKAPEDPKKRVKELEEELKKITDYADSADKKIAELYAEMKKTADKAESTSGAGMDLLESTRAENEFLKAENADLKGKLEEAHAYAENADKRITELEAELKKATASETIKKEPKVKQTDK
ncbi:MAG: hypothetical protein HFI89_06185 [Lachnospiraceae bacterium]|nr:hypothetical protein [Lachnospiraceae bacterium]